MSYDVALHVRVYGAEDVYAKVAEPEYSEPTYNLREMFVACMGWDYSQSEEDASTGKWHTVYYPCAEVLDYATNGLRQLVMHPDKYRQYNPPNGWGDINSARQFLQSLIQCIKEVSTQIPIDCLYMSW